MHSLNEELNNCLNAAPENPGVYQYFDARGKIIYVGKAKNLKNRVRSYFQNSKNHAPKTLVLVKQIQRIEYLLTQDETSALILESNLIKKHKPRYNIRLKDDKSFSYLKLDTSHAFPRLYRVRKIKRDRCVYYGPFLSGQVVRDVQKLINKSLLLRDCSDREFENRSRPCLNFEIGICSGPCVNKINREDYRKSTARIEPFFRGQWDKLLKPLQQEMLLLSSSLEYEKAANIRDRLKGIQDFISTQNQVTSNDDISRDLIFMGASELAPEKFMIYLLFVRGGKVLGGKPFWVTAWGGPETWFEQLETFLLLYYQENLLPEEVVIDVLPEMNVEEQGAVLQASLRSLSDASTHSVQVRNLNDLLKNNQRVKINEAFIKLQALGRENLKFQLAQEVQSASEEDTLEMIKEKLGLTHVPFHMECLDISNFQGKQSVGSCVVFKGGVPDKAQYRRYRFDHFLGQDDFGMIRDLIERRYFKEVEPYPLPDLLIIDGGKGQLSAALSIFKAHNVVPSICSLAKSRTDSDFSSTELHSSEERIFLPNRANPLLLKRGAPDFNLFTSIRDEAHRFAIGFQRARARSDLLNSGLARLKGFGPKKRQYVLSLFQSPQEFLQATHEQIFAINKLTSSDKQLLWDYIKNLEKNHN